MNAISPALVDSAVMFRRNLMHLRRYPSMTAILVGMPVVFLLLFVYVFGGTLGAGLPGAGGRAEYLAYVTPAIVVMAAASVAQGTAISVATDMTEGIIARFRTMAVSPGSVLTGHVLASVLQGVMAMATIVLVAIALGFRPDAGPLGWLALLGVLTFLALALTWLSVALGLVSDSVETASNLPMFLIILPFLGSGFVPTDSMPTALRWFAEYQPFTPIIETVRGLLAGDAEIGTALLALGWCALITFVGYLWARSLMRRERTR